MAINNSNYHEQLIKANQIKLREHLKALPPFCKDFFIGIDKRAASRTQIAYAYDLGVFFEYIHNETDIGGGLDITDYSIDILDRITATDIEMYMQHTKYYVRNDVEYTNSERGMKRKLSSLKSFYNFFYEKERIKTNPASIVKLPKLHEKEIVRLDVNEVAELLDQVESGEKLTEKQKTYHKKTKVRDVALLSLLLGTGIRVSECVGIDINDIDFNNFCVKVRRKGGYESTVYFSDEVCEALLDYMEERVKINAVTGHENAFFLSMQQKRLGVRSVENLVTKYSSLVTTIKHITPHKLRSTYGTNLYKETGDIYLVADVLGHKDVNTTRKHYAAMEDERRRSARNIVPLREKHN